MITRFVLPFLFFASSAQAAIPQSHTIAARVARAHGKSVYIIEQDVQFRTNAEPLVLRERWVVENGERMRLAVSASKSGESAHFEALYMDGKRTFTDPAGGIKTAAVSREFAEGFFHLRSGKSFLNALISSKIVPGDFVREKSKAVKIEQIHHFPDPYVRLGRENGSVAWIFGEPSPVEGKLNPQAWIEQDSFILRRLRFPSEAEISADRYTAYPNNLKFPRERTITWSGNTVTVRVVSVRATTASQVERTVGAAQFSGSVKPARLPELPQVREFYSRFR